MRASDDKEGEGDSEGEGKYKDKQEKLLKSGLYISMKNNKQKTKDIS